MYLSVIVPVFNGENYIDDLMKSLCQQTFRAFEVILVDDGSTDGSYKKCMHYAKQYDWVRAIHTENAGVSNARNIGVQEARGEWIQFIDVDDVIRSDMFEEFYKISQSNELDFMICGCMRKILKNNKEEYCGPDKTQIIVQEEIKELLDRIKMTDRYWALDYVWNKWFRREIIVENKLQFCPSLSWGEDFEFNAQYFQKVSSVALFAEPYYQYRVGENGLVSKFREKAWIGGMKLFKAQKALYQAWNLWETNEAWIRRQNGQMALGNIKLINSVNCRYNEKQKRKFIEEMIKSEQFPMILEYLQNQSAARFAIYKVIFSSRRSWLIYVSITIEKYINKLIRKDK